MSSEVMQSLSRTTSSRDPSSSAESTRVRRRNATHAGPLQLAKANTTPTRMDERRKSARLRTRCNRSNGSSVYFWTTGPMSISFCTARSFRDVPPFCTTCGLAYATEASTRLPSFLTTRLALAAFVVATSMSAELVRVEGSSAEHVLVQIAPRRAPSSVNQQRIGAAADPGDCSIGRSMRRSDPVRARRPREIAPDSSGSTAGNAPGRTRPCRRAATCSRRSAGRD